LSKDKKFVIWSEQKLEFPVVDINWEMMREIEKRMSHLNKEDKEYKLLALDLKRLKMERELRKIARQKLTIENG
jgi:hypothetical protein